MSRFLAIFLLLVSPALAQVPAGPQQNPTGFATVGDVFWMGDQVNGFVGYFQGSAQIGDQTFSIGGGPNCLPFCPVGQIAQLNDSVAFIASPDPKKPRPGFVVGGGLWMIQFSGFVPPVSPLGPLTALTISKGIANDLPDAVALGPDGKLYYGGLANPNYRRVTNPTGDPSTQQVETFGSALNGQRIFSLAFSGSDLFSGTGDGFYLTPNAPACSGNQNNCGRPVLISGGATFATVSDALGRVYFAQANGTVQRYDQGTIVPVASGLSFSNNRAGLGLDKQGNLYIGEVSQIDLITAGNLP